MSAGRIRTLLLRAGIVVASVFVVLFLVGFLGAQRACAHDPRFACSARDASNPIGIGDAAKSWAFYGHLREGETDVYVVSVDRQERVPWSLLIDERDAANPARPFATVTRFNGNHVAQLDFSRSASFYEPFSREQYATTPESELALLPGRYRIEVGMRGGKTTQRYAMAIGAQERFGLLEIPYVFGAIHRIRSQNY